MSSCARVVFRPGDDGDEGVQVLAGDKVTADAEYDYRTRPSFIERNTPLSDVLGEERRGCLVILVILGIG